MTNWNMTLSYNAEPITAMTFVSRRDRNDMTKSLRDQDIKKHGFSYTLKPAGVDLRWKMTVLTPDNKVVVKVAAKTRAIRDDAAAEAKEAGLVVKYVK